MKNRRGFLATLAAIPAAIALPVIAAPRNPTVVALENTLQLTRLIDQVRSRLDNQAVQDLLRSSEALQSFGRGQTKSIYQIDELCFYSHDQVRRSALVYPRNVYGDQEYDPYPHTSGAILAMKHLDARASLRMFKEREAYDRLHGLKSA